MGVQMGALGSGRKAGAAEYAEKVRDEQRTCPVRTGSNEETLGVRCRRHRADATEWASVSLAGHVGCVQYFLI